MSEKLAIYDEEKTVAGLKSVNGEVDITVAKFRELMGVVNQASQGFSRATPREFVQAMERSRTVTEGMTTVTNQLTASERRLAQVERQLAIATSDQANQIANVTARTRILTAEQRNRALAEEHLAALSDRERQRLGNTLQIYNSVQQKLVKLQGEYRNLATAKQLGMTLTDKEIARMTELEKRIQRYDQTLKAVDGSMGIYRRNVGNYASGFNAMNNSVAQLAREAPAFTYSMQTGFMALSNNIPIFYDAMRAAREENVRLRAEGSATVPVWKQLTSAIFSWNTLLSIGITLLTVYGKEIGEWIKKLWGGIDATSILNKNTKDLNASRKDAAKSSASEISQLEKLYKVSTNASLSYEQRMRAVRKLQDLYPSFFGNLSAEIIMTGKARDKYLLLRDAILDSARARAIGNKLAERQAEQLEKEENSHKEIVRTLTLIDKIRKAKIEGKSSVRIEDENGFGAVYNKDYYDEAIVNIKKRNKEILTEVDRNNKNFTKANAYLLNTQIKIEGKKNVAAYDSDKYGKDAPKPQKEKPYNGSRLDGSQKDYLKDLQASRDLELAINETAFIEGKQDELKYLDEVLRINTSFFNKKITFLKGKNAEERKQRADAILDQAKLEKDTDKKKFDILEKQADEHNKIKINELERAAKQIEENQYISDVDRLNQQISNDSQIISQLSSNYDSQIALAKKYNQDTLEIERKRDEEIGKIQDNRLVKVNSLPEAFNKDVDRVSEMSDNLQNKDYEEQRLAILQAKVPLRDREFLLSQLELQNNETSLLNQRNDLELKKNSLDVIAQTKKLTKEQESQYGAIESEISGINSQLETTKKNLEQLKLDKLLEDLQPLKDLIGGQLQDLGLENVSKQFDEMFKKIVEGSFTAKDAVIVAASAIADGLTAINNTQKENTIAALDEQLKYTQETTEQELEFINNRLDQLNALETLTEEQYAQRNALEDEARTIKEQQAQREKMIEAQKARAEQKAAAQQALINGALAATMALATMPPPASYVMAAVSFGLGVAQSVAIMSKDPVPKYFVGRKGGKAEVAITQDGGREFISNDKGEITSLGSDNGDQLTYLNKGDNVHTAAETKSILKRMGAMPKLGENIFQKIALQSLRAPAPVVINQMVDNSDAIADKIAAKFDLTFKKYTHPTTERINGKIIRHRGSNLGEVMGYYDMETGKEISIEDHQNKNNDTY